MFTQKARMFTQGARMLIPGPRMFTQKARKFIKRARKFIKKARKFTQRATTFWLFHFRNILGPECWGIVIGMPCVQCAIFNNQDQLGLCCPLPWGMFVLVVPAQIAFPGVYIHNVDPPQQGHRSPTLPWPRASAGSP